MKQSLKNGNIYLIIAFAMMIILFISSSQTYEQQSSIPFLQKILSNQPFKKQLSGIAFMYAGSEVSISASGYYKFIEFFIRKAAHFGTYFILSGSWFLGLRKKIKNNLFIVTIISWLSATGYAALDEAHQMLTGGRSPLFQDVMLDSVGALTACVICLLGIAVIQLPKKRKHKVK